MTDHDTAWTITALSAEHRDAMRTIHSEAFPGEETVVDVLGDAAVVLGALMGDDVIGYLVARRQDAQIELWEHVVAAGHRGEGVGRSLLQHLLSDLDSNDVVIVDPAGLLDDERLADYYGDQGFHRLDSGEIGAIVAEVDGR